jgi:hypothetical protein
MRFTLSIAAPLYVAAAVIDLYLSLITSFIYPSVFFRAGWVTSLMALYVHLASGRHPLKPLPLALASLVCTAVLVPNLPPLAIVNLALKCATLLFTVKPDLILIEAFEENYSNSEQH